MGRATVEAAMVVEALLDDPGVVHGPEALHEVAPGRQGGVRQADDTVGAALVPQQVDMESGKEEADTVARDEGLLSVRWEEVEEGVVVEASEGLVGPRVHVRVLHFLEVHLGDQGHADAHRVTNAEAVVDLSVGIGIDGEEADRIVAQKVGARALVAPVLPCPEAAVAVGALDPGPIVAQGQEAVLTVDQGHGHLDHDPVQDPARFQLAQVEVGEEALFLNGELQARIAKRATKVEVTFVTASLAVEAGVILPQVSNVVLLQNFLLYTLACSLCSLRYNRIHI